MTCLFDAVNLPDVGVIQGGQDLHFPLKPGHSLGIRGKLLGQDLQRHVPVQLGIGGTVDHSHAAFTDLLQNLVMANGRADHASSWLNPLHSL